MRILELSSKDDKDGRRQVKVILHEIYKDKSQHNKNGITWLEEYCKNNIDSVKGISITCEFVNDERTEILGHGETGIEDGVPLLENATMIGVLERGYIDDIKVDGETKRALIGEGYIDAMRYKNFVDVLEEKLHANETIFGSVEIIGLKENGNRIKYLNGYQEIGRIPTEYRYSGFAVLGVMPSDETARLIEINNRKGIDTMEKLEKIFEKFEEKFYKTDEYKQELEKKQKENEDLKAQNKFLADKLKENDRLKEELDKLKSSTLKEQLNAALADFSDKEKEVAKESIEKFSADPINSDESIQDIVDTILVAIGKEVCELKKKKVSEQNSYKYEDIDILEEVFEINETSSIF
ncbi:MAG: hypothetical protein J6D52_02480 [Clostridia bacterium]|nr:hypothetical protein [Clostridia bacterium]